MNEIVNKVLYDQSEISADCANPLVFYGAGQAFSNLYKEKTFDKIRLCDSDPNKIGTKICGITVQAFKDVVEQDNDFQLVISSRIHYSEIKEYVCRFINESRIVQIPSSYLNYYHLWKHHAEELGVLYNALYGDYSKETLIDIIKAHKYNNAAYFPSSGKKDDEYFDREIINLSQNEVFIDGGAYNGDTLLSFTKKTKNIFKSAYCFEPNYQLMKKIPIALPENESRITLLNKGLWDSDGFASFDINPGGKQGSSKISHQGKAIIETTTIDNCISEEVTFIKLDIEGAELAALRGAKRTILKNKPKLAICVYHKAEDIIEIPRFIMNLGLDYKYYLRQYVPSFATPNTVFYAV